MKHLLSLLLLGCCSSTLAQTLPDSLAAYQQVVHGADSLLDEWPAVPDSLESVFARADSIRAEFSQTADSLQSQYAQTMAALEEQESRINGMVDSLSRLGAATDEFVEPLNKIRSQQAQVEKQFKERLEVIKAKATDKLTALDLPPEYRKPLDELTSAIDNVALGHTAINIPALNVPGLDLPEINLGNLPDMDIPSIEAIDLPNVDPSIGELTSVGEYADKVQDVAANITDVDKVAASIESQASRVEGLDELQKQSGVIDGYKTQFEDFEDPDKAKAKAVDMARKAAIDHFAGREEQLKAAIDKVSKYKQKYSSVASIKDLPKRPPNPMKNKPFIERLVPGLTFQYQRKNAHLIDIHPYVGYRLSGRLTLGLGWNHRYAWASTSGTDHRSRIFGPRAFLDFSLGKGFIAHVEGEAMNTFVPSTLHGNPDSGSREWVWGCMTGLKKRYNIYKNLKGTVLIQYNIFDPHHKSPYVDRVNSRIGLEYTFKTP